MNAPALAGTWRPRPCSALSGRCSAAVYRLQPLLAQQAAQRCRAVMEAACVQALHEASEALKCNIRRKPTSADIRLLLKVNVTIAELAMKQLEDGRAKQIRRQAPLSSGAPGDARRDTRS